MASILSIGTALPGHCYSTGELLEAGRRWLAADEAGRDLFERFLRSSKTETRNFVEPVAELLRLNGAARRAELFEQHGAALGERSLRAALQAAGLRPAEIGSIVFTSCTCPVIPSIDSLLIERVGLERTVKRVPIYQHGCAGGVVGLGLAQRLCGPEHPVVLDSVELCSLVFYPQDHTGGHLVGASLFADGAASVIISPADTGLCFVDTCSQLIPDSRHLMGYDIFDDGAHLRLDRDLPARLIEHVPQMVDAFLAEHRLTRKEVPWWLFHPGGIKILNFLDQTFALSWSQSRWSREVLAQVGNLSSASVLFVLDYFLRANPCAPGDHVLLLGVGPGLTIELILFQFR